MLFRFLMFLISLAQTAAEKEDRRTDKQVADHEQFLLDEQRYHESIAANSSRVTELANKLRQL